MYRIAICDDNPRHLRALITQVASVLSCSEGDIFAAATAEDVLNRLSVSGPVFDILLLDIALGDGNGLALAKQVNTMAPACQIIFVTGYLDFAPDVYVAEHTYFVLKAQLEEKLPLALAQAVKKLSQIKNASLSIKTKGTHLVLLQNEVIYIERVLRQSLVCCETRTAETYEKLEELLVQLDAGLFVRCHKSYVVNLGKVRRYQRHMFAMQNGASVPISRPYEGSAKAAFFRHMGK